MKFNKDPRHLARKIALNYVYSNLISAKIPNIDYIIVNLGAENYNTELFNKIIKLYYENKDLLDEKVNPFLVNWNREQLLDLDILIIKIAVLEVLIGKFTPVKVAVDEAVELAKEFGSEKSGKFVNGVLAKLIEQEK